MLSSFLVRLPILQITIENSKHRGALYQTIQKQLDDAISDNRDIALVVIKVLELQCLEVNIGFSALELVSKRILARLLLTTQDRKYVIQTSLDSFIVIIPKMLNRGHLAIIAERFSREIRTAIKIQQETIELAPLIGISASDDCNGCGETLFTNALIALENGKRIDAMHMIYEPIFKQQMKKVWDLKKDIDVAIIENQFELYFQPKIDLKSMAVCGAEALIRWNHPAYGLVSPLDFIPVAEQSGQIHSITEWVIKSSIQQLAEIIKTDLDFKLSINISANNLDSKDLMLLLEDSLAIWNVPAQNLVIEVTETTIMSDAKSSLKQLERIRELGVGVSIDDFGTGYSSLAYFKKIPATELKIDKSFVDQLLDNADDRHIVSLIIFLAKRFNLTVVAEGIETKEVLDEILQLRCHYAQGYYFSKPLPYSQFVEWVNHF